jgi:hypothetical protein
MPFGLGESLVDCEEELRTTKGRLAETLVREEAVIADLLTVTEERDRLRATPEPADGSDLRHAATVVATGLAMAADPRFGLADNWREFFQQGADRLEAALRAGGSASPATLADSLDAPSDLNERRAWFVYEAARLAAAAGLAPIIPEPWESREEAFRAQFIPVVARECGPDRKGDPAVLHADWVKAYEAMDWRYGPERDPVAKTHPDMVPYDDLGQLERDKDAVFVALCDIARQWVYADPALRAVGSSK